MEDMNNYTVTKDDKYKEYKTWRCLWCDLLRS